MISLAPNVTNVRTARTEYAFTHLGGQVPRSVQARRNKIVAQAVIVCEKNVGNVIALADSPNQRQLSMQTEERGRSSERGKIGQYILVLSSKGSNSF